MSLSRLVLRNILDSLFRSGAILICAVLVAGLGLLSTLVVRGAEAGLRNNLSRMGADIIAIPWGTMSEDFSGAHLMGMMTDRWMPRAYMARLAAVEGVIAVSPQLYLSALHDTPYSLQPEVFLVAYDPATDFALRPWLGSEPVDHLDLGEAVVGALVSAPGALAAASDGRAPSGRDNRIEAYGYPLHLVRTLEPTGSDIDQTVFVSFETALALEAHVKDQLRPPFEIAPESISTAMVLVDTQSDPHQVAIRILEQVPGVLPIESTGFFQTQRGQLIGLLRSVLALLVITWALSVLFVGLVFSLAANERRRQLGVLRALGASGRFVLKSLLAEGITLAVLGGVVGVALAVGAVALAGDQIARGAGIQVYLPPTLPLFGFAVAGLALAVFTVTVAAWVPARRISLEEPSLAMRE